MDDAEMAAAFEQIDRAVVDSRAFIAEAEAGLRYPPELALQLAATSNRICETAAGLYLRLQGLDSPEGFARESPGLPFNMERILLQTIEWSHNNAIGFTMTGEASEPASGEEPHSTT